MPEPGNALNKTVARERVKDGAEDRDVPIRREDDEEEGSGRNWSVILILVVVPLAMLVGLVMSLHALFVQVFGTAQAPQTVIESTARPT